MSQTSSRKRKNNRDSSPSRTLGQDRSEDVWSRPNWPPRLEKVLVELLVEEMKYHLDVCVAGFNEEAWDHVCKEFNQETGLSYDKMELKKHVAVLKKRYRIVKPLYNHGGFGWDYHRKMVDVDDSVWEEYIEAYPAIKPYRKWGCPIYDELCTIFTKPIATGEYAFSPSELCSRSSSNISHSRLNANRVRGRNKRMLVEPMGSGSNKTNHTGAANSEANATPAKKSVSGTEGTAVAQTDDPYSVSHCLSVINKMQGVDRGLFGAAMDLFQNEHWRKIFISLKTEKRLSWLKAMLPSA